MLTTCQHILRDAINALARKHRDTQFPSAVDEQDADEALDWPLARSWWVNEIRGRAEDHVVLDMFEGLTADEAMNLFACAFIDYKRPLTKIEEIVVAVVRRHIAKNLAREANLVDLESEAA